MNIRMQKIVQSTCGRFMLAKKKCGVGKINV